jgi:acetyl-CoA carboxylase biotin carboxyl carrier protein
MNVDLIGQLVKILRETPELGAIEVRRGLFGLWSSVRVSKAGSPAGSAAGPMVVAAAPPTGGGAALVIPAVAGAAGAATPAPGAANALLEIKSPMVGTFYKAPEPGAEAYAKVGTRVAPGQVVCIIEAMKIMNEIEAEVQGIVREVCVDNAQPVEFGQVLFRVDPHG